MKKLRTKTPSALNQPSAWNQYLKPWFNVEAFQARINDRVGLNRDGRPIVRLVWGQDVRQHVFTEETPRYWTRRLKKLDGYIWYTIPRWILERRMEPEQYAAAWNATRYSLKDPTQGTGQRCEDCGSSAEPEILGGKLYCRNCAGTNIAGGAVIDKGPPPNDHYQFFHECAVHEGMMDEGGWPLCCSRHYYTDRTRCWGEYRPPTDFDLMVVDKAVRAMEADKTLNPYAELTPERLKEAELASNMQIERAEIQFAEFERELQKDFLRTYPYPGYELGASHFSDLGPSFKKAESGIVVPAD